MARCQPDHPGVVISGMGIVSPIGETVPQFWSALRAGRSAIGRWADARDSDSLRVIGDLMHWDLAAHLSAYAEAWPDDLRARLRRLLRPTPVPGRATAIAALQALADAGWPAIEPGRLGHVLAGHNLNSCYHTANRCAYEDDPESIESLFILISSDTDAASLVCDLAGGRGPSFTTGAACASGGIALLLGLDLIRSGRADAVLVAGAPMEMEPTYMQGFALLGALSIASFNDTPERASRPFDALREGFVPGMAAAAMLLERADHAQARGARAWATLRGAAATTDACRHIKPSQDGEAQAIRLALSDAGAAAADVDYVNAHAASTPLGDAVEVAAIKEVLGERAREIPVNSTKSMLGHCLTSAGVVEAVATVLQLHHGIVHPTINQEVPDPALDLDFVPNVARAHRIDTALCHSFGMGGFNSVTVFGRPA